VISVKRPSNLPRYTVSGFTAKRFYSGSANGDTFLPPKASPKPLFVPVDTAKTIPHRTAGFI
jgi:hypothetical protein